MTRARLDSVFAGLKARLVPLAAEAAARSGKEPGRAGGALRDGTMRFLLEAVGFDFERGALSTASHPGTSALGFDDIRLSLRADGESAVESVLVALHEAGHALYDQGYDPADRGTLLAAAPSMALHEANARLWENHVGRSRAFADFIAPRLDGLSAEDFFRAANRVRPSLRRSSADELTYHLHILLRYELETQLVAGTLAVKDLPEAWREASRTLLGLVPGNDSDGVLQDGHWAAGMFGYFPTYTIGSLYAAQLMEACAASRDLDGEFARGNFSGLLGFLRSTVHRIGDRMTGEEIIIQATGSGLDADAFFRHLTGRYS